MRLEKTEHDYYTGNDYLYYVEMIGKSWYYIKVMVDLKIMNEKILEAIKENAQKQFDEKRRELALRDVGLFYN